MPTPGLIDWRLVGFSALWILGLSIVLAAVSFADYEASRQAQRTRVILREPRYRLAWNGGLALFCLGWLGTASAWWVGTAWLGLAAWFGYETWQAWRESRAPGP